MTNEETESLPKDKSKTILIVLLVLSIGFNIFLFLNNSNLTGNAVSAESYKYVHPLTNPPIDLNFQEPQLILHYEGLRNILETDIKKDYNEGKVGIFVQDTKTGSWIGINERDKFAPASLLKIPIMIAILKKVQREEISMDKKITIIQQDLNSDYGTVYEKGAGTELTVAELLTAMISSSDNTATNALKRQLSLDEVDSVFVHVGIPNPYLLGNDPLVSPRGYSRLFKSLYFSTYLNHDLSEFALDLTTDSVEENLISKSIPPHIQVAHKFGIKENILHDCGIIYHPDNPYFICVMTKDMEQKEAKKLIANISLDIYNFVDKK